MTCIEICGLFARHTVAFRMPEGAWIQILAPNPSVHDVIVGKS